MGRPPTDPDKKMMGFTVKLTPQQLQFLDSQKVKLDVQFGADVVRDIVEGLRTWFGLPAYQVELLQKPQGPQCRNIGTDFSRRSALFNRNHGCPGPADLSGQILLTQLAPNARDPDA